MAQADNVVRTHFIISRGNKRTNHSAYFFYFFSESQRFHFQCESQQKHSFSTWTTCNGPNSTQSIWIFGRDKLIVIFVYDPLGLLLSFEIMLHHSQSQSHIWLQNSDYILSSDSIISAHSFSCEAEIRKKVIIYTCRHWNQVCSFAFPWSPFQVLLEKFSSVTSTMYINFAFFSIQKQLLIEHCWMNSEQSRSRYLQL